MKGLQAAEHTREHVQITMCSDRTVLLSVFLPEAGSGFFQGRGWKYKLQVGMTLQTGTLAGIMN